MEWDMSQPSVNTKGVNIVPCHPGPEPTTRQSRCTLVGISYKRVLFWHFLTLYVLALSGNHGPVGE